MLLCKPQMYTKLSCSWMRYTAKQMLSAIQYWLNKCMRAVEFMTKTIKPIKPLTPQQARIASLKQQKERAGKLLKAEKDRQKQQKATQQINKAQQTLRKL